MQVGTKMQVGAKQKICLKDEINCKLAIMIIKKLLKYVVLCHLIH